MEDNKRKNLVDPYAYMRAFAAITIFIYDTNVFSGMNGYVINESNWFMKTAAHGAVWVFFFLSGYFNIRSFLGSKPDYRLDRGGIVQFYLKRFFRVLLPVWCFYLVALSLSEPAFLQVYPETIWRLLTFTYSGEPGCTSIAGTWYVSSLTWLYLFTPAMAWICRKLDRSDKHARILIVFFIMAVLGLVARFALLLAGIDWTQGVFVPFYCNLDIYICGGLAYSISKRIRMPLAPVVSYALSFIIFTVLLIIHSRIYYLGDADGIYLVIYDYVMPTVYILITTLVCTLIQNAGYRYLPVKAGTVIKNPLRLIDAFSRISFQFYLIHNMVLFSLSTVVLAADSAEYNRKMLIYGFIISVLLSILFKRATDFTVPGRSVSVNAGRTVRLEKTENAVRGDDNEPSS